MRVAVVCRVALIAGVIWVEKFARERLGRADVNASPAFAATGSLPGARGTDRSVCQYGCPARTRADLRRDEQTASPNPAKTGKVSRHLVRENAAEAIRVHRAGCCRDRQGRVSMRLQDTGQAKGRLVEYVVDQVVAVVPVQFGRDRVRLGGEAVDDLVDQGLADGESP